MEEKKKHKEIDVIALAIKVLKEWKTLLIFLMVSGILGLIVTLSTPREYTSQVVLAPELSSGGIGMSGNLSDLASSFGIDLGKKTSMDAIYPELYPDIFVSTDFVLQLFDVKVRLENDPTPKTYLEHIQKDTKVPFWRYPMIWLTEMLKSPEKHGKGAVENDPYRLSKQQHEICASIANSIVCLIDKKTSEISISFTDQDPMVAAIMTDTLQHRLQTYITEYRTKKARIDYEYYKKMTAESKLNYEKALRAYASYSDSHKDILLQSYKARAEQLENELQLQYNVYNQMSAQMKAAEAKIQERTPAFTVIQSSYMPDKPSSRRSRKLFLFLFLGVLADAAWVLVIRERVSKKKKQEESTDTSL